MRATIGRTAFRSASHFLSPGTSRGPAVVTRHWIKSRKLCSTPAVSSDGVRKPEDSGVSTAAKATTIAAVSQIDRPEVDTIAQDTIISSGDTAAKEITTAKSSEESGNQSTTVDEGAGSPLTSQVKKNPEALRKLLNEALQKRAARSALWYYVNALKVPDQPGVDANVVKIMLPLLGRYGWAPSSMDTLKLAIEKEQNLGVGYFNCGLHAISRSGDVRGFAEILEGMWGLPRESHPNATSYTYLIGAHVYRGAIDDAFEVLRDMKKHMIYPTFATYHALITGCLRRRDPQRAYSTLLAVEKQRFEVSAMTVAQVLVSSAQNDYCEHVLDLIAKLEESLPRYAAEMHRIAENRATYRLTGEERTTKEERSELRGDPKPEIGAISEVLHCAFRKGRADVGMAGWDMLKRYYPDMEVPPSLWYCMIGAFSGSGDFSRAFDVLGAMKEAGHKPSLKDLEVALIRPLSFDVTKIDEQFFRLADKAERQANEKSGDTQDANPAQSSEDMQSASSVSDVEPRSEESAPDVLNSQETSESNTDSQPDGVSLSAGSSDKESLADILSKPDVLEANSIQSQFSSKTVGIDELNCIIAACSFAGDLDRAFQTYDEVESRFHFERNADTFNALLEGCVQVRHVRGGLRILKEMESVGMKVTDSTVHLAVRLLLRGGRLREAVDMVRNVQADGGTVPMQTYQMLVRHCVRGGSTDQAATVIKIASEAGVEGRTLTGRLNIGAINKLKTIDGLNLTPDVQERTSGDSASLDERSIADVEGDLDPVENLDVETEAIGDEHGSTSSPRDHTEGN